MDNNKILRQIYYSEDGFDSKAVTLRKANKNNTKYNERRRGCMV